MHRRGYSQPVKTVSARRIDSGSSAGVQQVVAEETPVTLAYNGVSHAVMMATPADLEDFALGFSLTEGLVADIADITRVEVVRYSLGVEIQMETSAPLS